MSISYRKLDIALSADKETVLVFGQELSTKYFTEIVVTTMLNSTGSDMANSNRILNDIHAAGLDAGDYGKYSRWWAQSNAQERQRLNADVKKLRHIKNVWLLFMRHQKRLLRRSLNVKPERKH